MKNYPWHQKHLSLKIFYFHSGLDETHFLFYYGHISWLCWPWGYVDIGMFVAVDMAQNRKSLWNILFTVTQHVCGGMLPLEITKYITFCNWVWYPIKVVILSAKHH